MKYFSLELTILRALSVMLIVHVGILPPELQAQDNRDSLDLLATSLELDITDFDNQVLSGTAHLEFNRLEKHPRQARLMLYRELRVSKVEVDETTVHYHQQADTLFVSLPRGPKSQRLSVTITYSGTPQQDPKWGGFYWREGYAFNMGVAFVEQPHPFGRSWFPALDRFYERSHYRFAITTPPDKKAFASGLADSTTKDAQGYPIWHWSTRRPVPSYLVGIAVGPYETLRDTILRKNDTLSIVSGVAAGDTAGYFGAFSKLKKGFRAFERHYGPYRFPRVGYAVVPFRSGAMEHSTNIAYPDNALNRDLRSERLWAHELSHAWWGNLVTCHTAEDMWLNEGFASYSEHLFIEAMYGREAYLKAVEKNHRNFLRYGTFFDKGPRAISPMPQQFTYGQHVYHKGADMLHNLRSFMGDEAFFKGLRKYLQDYAFSTATSDQLRQTLETSSGLDLQDFFNNWIFTPGYIHPQLDSFRAIPSGDKTQLRLFLSRQFRNRRRHQAALPLYFKYFDQQGNVHQVRAMLPSNQNILDLEVDAQGVRTVMLDPEGMLSDATTDFSGWIKDFTNPKGLRLEPVFSSLRSVEVRPDSVYLHLQHHWVGAEQQDAPPGYVLSPERFWSVHWDGNEKALEAVWTVTYNGSIKFRDRDGLLDTALMALGPEDSLVLMYRPHADARWAELSADEVTYFREDTLDMKGRAQVNNFRQGQYGWALRGISAGEEVPEYGPAFTLISNPARRSFEARFSKKQRGRLKLINLKGVVKKTWNLENQPSIRASLEGLPAGRYFLRLETPHYTGMRRLYVNP